MRAALIILATLAMSGCATIGDLEVESIKREALAKGVEAEDAHLIAHINTTIDKMKALDIRVKALETLSRPMVRDCGATIGDHFAAEDFHWVQPCERDDYEGCSEDCRHATSDCEAARAAFREKPHGQSLAYVESLSDRIKEACGK